MIGENGFGKGSVTDVCLLVDWEESMKNEWQYGGGEP